MLRKAAAGPEFCDATRRAPIRTRALELRDDLGPSRRSVAIAKIAVDNSSLSSTTLQRMASNSVSRFPLSTGAWTVTDIVSRPHSGS